MRSPSPARSALAALAAFFLISCGNDRFAGTSSGVDNPQLTVSFRDDQGQPLHISGDLDVYSGNQNPALDPLPLWTIRVRDASFANLTGDDFRRIREVAMKRAAAKRAASALSKTAAENAGTLSDPDSALTVFNLLLRTENRSGALLRTLRYDSASGKFEAALGVPVSDLEIRPRPLVGYQAKLDPVKSGDLERVFVPGTPFLGTLVDSDFSLGEMPPGVFPLGLVAADGYLYAIRDSLDTRVPGFVHQALPDPVGKINAADAVFVPGFAVHVNGLPTTTLGMSYLASAKVDGIDAGNPRISYLWRQLPDPGGTGTLPSPKAIIHSPAAFQTEIGFPAAGRYLFGISAIVGLQSVSDTLIVEAKDTATAFSPRILQPQPGDTLVAGVVYKVAWSMPADTVRVEVNMGDGASWMPIEKYIFMAGDTATMEWAPPSGQVASDSCLIRVISWSDTTRRADMKGFFSFRP